MGTKLAALLGGWLKWFASLGTVAVSAFVFWLLSLLGFEEAKTNPYLWGVIVAAAAKLSGWFIATYGPRPTVKPQPVAKTTRKPRPKMPGLTGNGPNGPSEPSTANNPNRVEDLKDRGVIP